MVNEIDVYEVDHPASQRWKRNRVAHLGLIVPDRLHYVPIDFERQTLTRGLMEARLDPSRRTFFSCLGVTQYLTPEANLDLLDQVSQLSVENTITLEFIAPPETLFPEDAAVIRGVAEGTAAVGEPWLSFFSFDDMEAVLRQYGFGSIERFGAAEATTEYGLAQPPRHVPGYFRMITATSGSAQKS